MNTKKLITAVLLSAVLILSALSCKDKQKADSTEKSTEYFTSSPAPTVSVTLPNDIGDGWEGPHVTLEP